MDQVIVGTLGDQRGAISGDQLARLGATAAGRRSALRSGQLMRVRRGAFVDGRRFRAAAPSERYAMTVRAVLLTRPGDAAWRHAALALHGMPLWHVDLARVDVLSDVVAATGASGVLVHPRSGRAVGRVDGLPVARLADAIVATAASSGLVAGVVAADAAVHHGLLTPTELKRAASEGPPVRGCRRVAQLFDFVDGGAESPGESVVRMILALAGLPVRTQVSILDEEGAFVARVDVLVGGRVVVEFDGAVKYADGDGRAVIAEKVREDRLRSLGYAVVRATWADLRHPERLVRRVRATGEVSGGEPDAASYRATG